MGSKVSAGGGGVAWLLLPGVLELGGRGSEASDGDQRGDSDEPDEPERRRRRIGDLEKKAHKHTKVDDIETHKW